MLYMSLETLGNFKIWIPVVGFENDASENHIG